jgi:hypothetical protein
MSLTRCELLALCGSFPPDGGNWAVVSCHRRSSS